jgi:hypothetical protein
MDIFGATLDTEKFEQEFGIDTPFDCECYVRPIVTWVPNCLPLGIALLWIFMPYERTAEAFIEEATVKRDW